MALDVAFLLFERSYFYAMNSFLMSKLFFTRWIFWELNNLESIPAEKIIFSIDVSGPPPNLGSALASSMHLTNSSDPMIDPSSHYKMIEPSHHDMLYYPVSFSLLLYCLL